jgi:putative Holliday junction resolvase
MVIVALDVGQVRIGVAVSDASEQIAFPQSVLRRRSNAEAIAAIVRLVAEAGAGLLVVGLPISLDGQLHVQAQKVRAFAEKLRARLPVPLVYADETLSTWRAEEMLRAAGVRPERLRARIDAAAAAVILQEFLDLRQREHAAAAAHDDATTPGSGERMEGPHGPLERHSLEV